MNSLLYFVGVMFICIFCIQMAGVFLTSLNKIVDNKSTQEDVSIVTSFYLFVIGMLLLKVFG